MNGYSNPIQSKADTKIPSVNPLPQPSASARARCAAWLAGPLGSPPLAPGSGSELSGQGEIEIVAAITRHPIDSGSSNRDEVNGRAVVSSFSMPRLMQL